MRMRESVSKVVRDRIEKFKAFYARRDAGDLLFVCGYCPPGFSVGGLETGLDLARFASDPAGYGRDKVRECRARFRARRAPRVPPDVPRARRAASNRVNVPKAPFPGVSGVKVACCGCR